MTEQAVGYESSSVSYEEYHHELNQLMVTAINWARYSGRSQMSQESAERLMALSAASETPLLSAPVAQLLEAASPTFITSAPVISGLRAVSDFPVGMEVYLKQPEKGSKFISAKVAEPLQIAPERVNIDIFSVYTLLHPGYLGLQSKEDFNYYKKNHVSQGNGPSAAFINFKCTILLTRLEIGQFCDDNLFVAMRRSI